MALAIGVANFTTFQETLDQLPGATYAVFERFSIVWSAASGLAIALVLIPDKSLRIILITFAVCAAAFSIANALAPFGFFVLA